MELKSLIREYLRAFWMVLKRCFNRTKLVESVNANEPLTRFIFEKRQFSSKELKPKQLAFMPPYEASLNRFELSVCRTSTINETRIWHLGRTIRAREKKVALARADFRMPISAGAQLSCQADTNDTFPEHALIVGWPNGPDIKALHMSIASEFVYLASLKLPPSDYLSEMPK